MFVPLPVKGLLLAWPLWLRQGWASVVVILWVLGLLSGGSEGCWKERGRAIGKDAMPWTHCARMQE